MSFIVHLYFLYKEHEMKAKDLRAVWEAPDNSRLMKKQTSVRLATHIGARIDAICHLFLSVCL